MQRTSQVARLFPLCLVVLGCAHGVDAPPSLEVAELPAQSIIVLNPPTIDLEFAGSAQASERVIRSPAELDELWKGRTGMWRGNRTLPVIDFDKYILLYITVGSSLVSATRVAFTGVIETDREIQVEIVVTGPGRLCLVNELTCIPAALALLPRTDKQIRVIRHKGRRDCEP
jgi:hypothetical protein